MITTFYIFGLEDVTYYSFGISLKFRCLCSAGKVSGKGASVVEYLIQLFNKRLEALGFDNKQVNNLLRNFSVMTLGLLSLLLT